MRRSLHKQSVWYYNKLINHIFNIYSQENLLVLTSLPVRTHTTYSTHRIERAQVKFNSCLMTGEAFSDLGEGIADDDNDIGIMIHSYARPIHCSLCVHACVCRVLIVRDMIKNQNC